MAFKLMTPQLAATLAPKRFLCEIQLAEAEMSIGGAAAVFEQLGAEPDLTRVEQSRARTL